jgi:hypothetical protein
MMTMIITVTTMITDQANNTNYITSEVLTAMKMKVIDPWDVTPCSPVTLLS